MRRSVASCSVFGLCPRRRCRGALEASEVSFVTLPWHERTVPRAPQQAHAHACRANADAPGTGNLCRGQVT